jgi:hypothetical protein
MKATKLIVSLTVGLLCTFLSVSLLRAQGIQYVAITCSSGPCTDSNNGSSWGSAVADLPTAYANLPAEGGTIYVSAGSFSFSSGIMMTTGGKYVTVIGSGPGSTNLSYTASSGTAWTISDGTGGNVGLKSKVSGLSLVTTVSGSTATGIQFGGTSDCDYCALEDVNVNGFQNLVISSAYGVTITNSNLDNCSSASNSTAFETISTGGLTC